MTKTTLFVAMLGALLADPSQAANLPDGRLEGSSPAPLRVWVSDHAGVEEAGLEEAIGEARRILGDAGIATSWILCTRPNQVEMPAACSAPAGPWILRLRVLSEQAARRIPISKANFGMAFPGEGDRLGSAADIFAERSLRFADEMGVGRTMVLGHVLAHEIGHLLLGRNSHAASGIMTARWKAKQLRSAEQGAFGFIGRQTKAMQRQVARRLAVREDFRASQTTPGRSLSAESDTLGST